jgi:hypothetical protein
MERTKLLLAFVVSALLLSSPCYALEWVRIFGGNDRDRGYSIQETDDGGFIVSGDTSSFGGTWALKLNFDGTVEWEKAYYGSYFDCLRRTSDGGYALAGDLYGADSDISLVKLYSDGTVAWEKAYSQSYYTYYEFTSSMNQTADGGYIVVGTAFLGGGDPYGNAFVLKVGSDGTKEWHKKYTGGGFEHADEVVQTSDGGYLVVGGNDSCSGEWVMKLLADGNIEWQKTYEGGELTSVRQTSDEGYVLAGSSSSGSGNADVWVLKLDTDGTVDWSRTYGGSGADVASSIQESSDGGYIMTGETQSFGVGESDIWILKLFVNGTIDWEKTYGGMFADYGKAIQETSDGGYVVAGTTKSFVGGGESDHDVFVLKLDANGDTPDCSFGTSNAVVADLLVVPGNCNIGARVATSESGTISVTVQGTYAEIWNGCILPVSAGFMATPTSGSVPLVVTFADESTGNIESWSWDFGDGGTSTQQNPSYTYGNAGDFTVSLTVTGPSGSDTKTKTDYIDVTGSGGALIIDKIKPLKGATNPREPGTVLRILGSGFGDGQGTSEVHIGPKTYGPGHRKIKYWSNTKIKVKLPKYKCEWFNGEDYRKRRIWVTVGGVNSNTKRTKVFKPDTCP